MKDIKSISKESTVDELLDTINEYRTDVLRTLSHKGYSISLDTRTLGTFLCGENWQLALEPFSDEFIENVQYNNAETSLPFVLYLQATYLLDRITVSNLS